MSSNKSFDYIIVGAGSAGCVLAYRLTADPSVSVLLIEAGGRDWHPLLKLPIAWTTVAYDPRFGWNYLNEAEPQLGDRRLPLPRGKMIGGSSSINANRYSRGHPRDYDHWRQMGLTGWGYSDVLPYFKRSEDSWRGENEYHGAGGPLRVRRGWVKQLGYEPLFAAAKAMGFEEVDDIHGAKAEGITRAELTVNNLGRRHSTARAFLAPARKRSNLTLVTKALTTRVVIEKGRAVGIEYQHGGETTVARASREVIVSAGAYNSPQLLMLSGIGPADHLREHGIAVVHDAPGVGKNLQEHPLVPVGMETREPTSYLRHLRMDRATMWMLRWFFTGGGAFSVNGNAACLFTRTRPELERPDVQLLFASIARDAQLWWPGRRGAQRPTIQCSISLQHPEAVGDLKLRSSNPADAPRIRLNLFGAQADIDTAIRGIRLAREIYATEPMKGLIVGELFPGTGVVSDKELAAYVLANAATTQHPCGTCRMGIDDASVVDGDLRVRGIEGLRVADASVMPSIPGGHINAPTIMIGEKAADLIRGVRSAEQRVAA